MRYAVTVTVNPDKCSQISHLALRFCQELIASGHTIQRLFFLDAGVLNGINNFSSLNDGWNQFIKDNHLDAVACVASAEKFYIRTNSNQVTDKKTLKPLHDGFTIGGLGQFVDGVVNAERVVIFGS